MEQEHHPWNYYIPENSKILIVGTFPPTKKNWSYDFFYPNKANLFWSVMAELADTELKEFSGDKAVEERKTILRKLKSGVTDMGKTVIRQNRNSSDENLTVQDYMDIFEILRKTPTIKKIIFTSSSGKSSAVGWFKDYMKGHRQTIKFPKTERPVKSYLDFSGRNIELVILHSTSRRAANRISFENLVYLYKNEIIN